MGDILKKIAIRILSFFPEIILWKGEIISGKIGVLCQQALFFKWRDGRVKKKNYSTVIEQGTIEYAFLNFATIKDVVVRCIFVEMHGLEPVVKIKKKNSDELLWDSFFQPIESIAERYSGTIPTLIGNAIGPRFETVYNSDDVKYWGKIYNKYLSLNENSSRYIYDEVNQIVRGKQVLGVLCRGTDYSALRPKNHPIQPQIDDVIEQCKRTIAEFHLDYIYLATDEKNIYEKFVEAFGEKKILLNKRQWYDSYHQANVKSIGELHFRRENDDYLKALEYISSIYILSNYSCFIGGNCGGTLGALLINEGNYKFVHVFNCGYY